MHLKSFSIAVIALELILNTGSLLTRSSEFDTGAPALNPLMNPPVPPNSDVAIQIEIAKNMEIACKGDRCELTSITNNGHKFSVTLAEGIGNNNVSSTGSVVVVGNGPTNGTSKPQPFVSLTLQYTYQNCTQTVLVPRALYRVINTYLRKLINEDGSTKKKFSPAEETMILFITTIMNQAKGCNL